jgi:tetratricopeptide (TPR) repeat protein
MHYRLGMALWMGGNPEQALGELGAALQLQPDLAEAHYQIGVILAAQEQAPGAIARLREALRLRPNWPEALASLAFTLATASSETNRDPVEALRAATQAVELTRNTNAEALDSFAAACATSGNYTEAARAATKAAELAFSAGDKTRAEQIQSRRKLYETGKPFRQ